MKSANRIIKWALLSALIIANSVTFAQVGTLTQTGNQTVCLGAQAYGVVLNAGSTYAWSVTPLAGGNGTLTVGTTPNLASVNWTSQGTATLQVTETNSSGCIGSSVLITVTVFQDNSISLTSYAGTDGQTVCINTAITNISYATTGATGATVTGLPAGVNGVWAGNVVTISGTPSVSGTFNYTVTLTGGCGVVTATGAITVTSGNTINLTSSTGTDAQTICINSAITNITYATTGVTGATVTGLPAGVTGVWTGNIVTISGTPSVSGTFNYTVTLTGGCGVVTATGTITVTSSNTISLTSAGGTDAQTVCINTAVTNITYATTGATGANVAGLPAGVNGIWAGNVVTISGTSSVSGIFTYTVTLTGGCSVVTTTGTITVTSVPATSPIYHN